MPSIVVAINIDVNQPFVLGDFQCRLAWGQARILGKHGEYKPSGDVC